MKPSKAEFSGVEDIEMLWQENHGYVICLERRLKLAKDEQAPEVMQNNVCGWLELHRGESWSKGRCDV